MAEVDESVDPGSFLAEHIAAGLRIKNKLA